MIVIRHFKPLVDKNKPVAEWGLDEQGMKDMEELLQNPLLRQLKKVLSSPEKKALITARAISEKFNVPLEEVKLVAEVDRSKGGYVEGDYTEIVRTYLNKEEFKYAWESRDHVEARIKAFVDTIQKEEPFALISHGMFLSIMLHKYFNENLVAFWKNLRFGHILEVEVDDLVKIWNND